MHARTIFHVGIAVNFARKKGCTQSAQNSKDKRMHYVSLRMAFQEEPHQTDS